MRGRGLEIIEMEKQIVIIPTGKMSPKKEREITIRYGSGLLNIPYPVIIGH